MVPGVAGSLCFPELLGDVIDGSCCVFGSLVLVSAGESVLTNGVRWRLSEHSKQGAVSVLGLC